MADTGASRLLLLDLPSVLDLRSGPIDVTFSASAQDPDGIKNVIIWYDRPLATQIGSHSVQIIFGYGDAWDDGSNEYTTTVLPHNIGGDLNITSVSIEDKLGNRTEVAAKTLERLGVDTSISVLSSNADTTPPALTQLKLPELIDLDSGHAPVEFSAVASDASEIEKLVVFFDRSISYSFGTTGSPSFVKYSLVLLMNFSSDDLSAAYQYMFSNENTAGPVDILRVELTDVYGNERTYTNEDLRKLGFATSFDLSGSAAPEPTTYVADLPDVLNIREGQTLDLTLDFLGMTNHSVSYEYDVSKVGGTASNTDISLSSGSGLISIASSLPTSRSETIPISVSRDGIAETSETAYLTVQLSGNISFADGGSLKVIQLNILDDNKRVGGDGKDKLYGTDAAEQLIGGAGNDQYYITAGDRVIELAGDGIDTVFTGVSHSLAQHVENLTLTGSDNIRATGNSLDNRLTGNTGSNVLNGRLGADTMVGARGDDTYHVDHIADQVIESTNSGSDTVVATVSYALAANVEHLTLKGNASINGTGNTLSNGMLGNAGANALTGGRGNDTLEGNVGRDTLLGSVGNDVLVGGRGADALSGGKGADRFVFNALHDSGRSEAKRDVVSDFSRFQGDKIDLTALDANQLRVGDQAFTFIGATKFSGQAGELRFQSKDTVTVIAADVDGDGTADFSLAVSKVIEFTTSDFIL